MLGHMGPTDAFKSSVHLIMMLLEISAHECRLLLPVWLAPTSCFHMILDARCARCAGYCVLCFALFALASVPLLDARCAVWLYKFGMLSMRLYVVCMMKSRSAVSGKQA